MALPDRSVGNRPSILSLIHQSVKGISHSRRTNRPARVPCCLRPPHEQLPLANNRPLLAPPVPYPPGRSPLHPCDVLFQRPPHSVRWIRANGAQEEEETEVSQDPPKRLVAVSVEDGVKLTWQAPGAGADSVTGYEILRRRPRMGEQALTTLVADSGSTDTVYVDDSVQVDVVYFYRVKALRGEVVSQQSNFVKITHQEPTSDDPPRLLTAVSIADGVQLSWEAPEVAAESVTGYKILRRRPRMGEQALTTLVADSGSTDTAYVDDSVQVDVEYVYRVKAMRGEVVSQQSNFVKITFN